GGFLLAALLSAAVVAAASQPGGFVARALSGQPLVALGRISYGVYIFHWPIFLAVTKANTGLAPVRLFVLRSALTIALAALSYVLIEQPVRAGKLPRPVAALGWANASVGLAACLVLTAAAPAVSASVLSA